MMSSSGERVGVFLLLMKMTMTMCEIFKKNGLKIEIEANLTVVDYLDVTLNLLENTHKPYMKPNDVPLYVHSQSNHPRSVLKNIPRSINDRLSKLSSSEEIFNTAVPPYQQAISDAGYDYKLKFQPPTASPPPKKNRTRTRQTVWFNPPFSLNVETNIGKEFFQIIDNFPKNNILAPIITRGKVKMSYRTMKNMDQIISSHNKKALADDPVADDEPVQPVCNCQKSKRHLCPLPGQCTVDANGPVESVVYRAEIKRTDTGGVEFYTGLTGGAFKKRWYQHCVDIRKYDPNDGSYGKRMSRYVGSLAAQNIPYEISWSIVTRAPTYSPVTKSCRLCLLEKYFIMFESSRATLNVKSEFFSSCPHKQKLLLKNNLSPG